MSTSGAAVLLWSVGIEAQGDRVLPAAPIVKSEAISEDEEAADGPDGPGGHGELR
jgi:hypothetical protein